MSARVLAASLAALGIAGVAPSAHACSCLRVEGTPDEQVEYALAEADAVFVARVIRSALKPDRVRKTMVYEDAQLEVVEVFKGVLRVGQVIRMRQLLSAGTCGQSSTNNPPWMYRVIEKDGAVEPLSFSKEWLVYSHGNEPIELSRCTRSSPLNVDGDKDVKVLRQIQKRGQSR